VQAPPTKSLRANQKLILIKQQIEQTEERRRANQLPQLLKGPQQRSLQQRAKQTSPEQLLLHQSASSYTQQNVFTDSSQV